jgi:hypothetical protein
VAEDVLGAAGQFVAGGGGPGAAGVAVEELDAAGAFEAGQALRGRRLGDPELAGGRSDRAGAVHGEHQAEVVDRRDG